MKKSLAILATLALLIAGVGFYQQNVQSGNDGSNPHMLLTDSTGRLILGAGTQSIGTVLPSFTPATAQSAAISNQTPITGSNTGAASAANVTLAGVAAKTTYITGFQITGAGATAASIITVTLTGTVTGTMNYNIVVPAGATTSITPLIVSFPVPVPASGVNTAIVVNVPSFGAGNTNSAVSAQGFQQ